MPPKRGTKRKTTNTPIGRAFKTQRRNNGADTSPSPSPEPSSNSGPQTTFDHTRPSERYGIVSREHYPAEMSNERCMQYTNGELPRPLEVLNEAISSTSSAREKVKVGDAVVHWFKRDLRLKDNTALSLAAKKAKENKVPLVGLFVVCPEAFEAHLTSRPRVDFILRSLQVLKGDLEKLDIPLLVATVDKRKDIAGFVLDKASEWGARHVFCNMEYEVDELRRETKLVRLGIKRGIDVSAVHDDTVVPPGLLSTQGGRQFAVYTPWFRAWLAHLHAHPFRLNDQPAPEKNSGKPRQKFADLFKASNTIPSAPESKALSSEEKERFAKLWPAGEHAALDTLEQFLSEKIGWYVKTRNFPAANSTSSVSVYLASGTLAARTAVRMARDANSTKKLDGGNEGIKGWISEVAWRDFYRHVIVNWPYVCMHKPFKLNYTNIEWEYDEEHYAAWCEGRTGYPIVDAAMRQLNHSGYMHNRCRMIVASFLSKHLLLDWRMGEKYFMEHLIDGDFCSNNGGWGFSSSTGVDPQPYFRIFNPLLQSEKFDEDGEYIRTWVPELKNIQGKAVHEPYERGVGAKAQKNGYPRPIVEHKASRERALKRYKEALQSDVL